MFKAQCVELRLVLCCWCFSYHDFVRPPLHNKPEAEVHLGHKLTGHKEEEEEEDLRLWPS
jgi:hypothetical protein